MLQALFMGKINPSEHAILKGAAHYPLDQNISEAKAFFKDFLSPENYKRLEDLETLYTNADELSDYEAFSYGFRLAALLMIEVFKSENNLLSN